MTSETEQNDVAIIVSSCDAYSDAWDPFFTLFFRYWPDCPFPVYLISNLQNYDDARVTTIGIPDDQAWASNLLTALDQIPARQLIYFQEDYFLQRPVSSDRMRQLLTFAEQQKAGFIRLCGAPDPLEPHDNEFGLGILGRGQKFRVSLQAAIWDRSTLMQLLIPGENGWQMEINGSRRSDALPAEFFGCFMNRPLIDYYFFTGILKGKWVPGALRLCRREGIPVDTSRRETHGEWPFIVRRFRNLKLVRTARDFLRARRAA